MNKNVSQMVLICVAAVLFGAGGTRAYFTHSRIVDNALCVGSNTIEIREDYEPPKILTPGDNIFRKKVEVENTGTVSCFVRVFADFSDYRIRDLAQISPDGSDYYSANDYANYVPEEWTYISQEEDSLLGGFYYYSVPLEAGKTTVPLFEKIKCSFQSAEEIREFDILVSAESVQIYDKNGAEFTGEYGYRDAWMEYLERR